MSQHQALVIPSKMGQPRVEPRPTPKPGPGEALVKIQATGVNPLDWKIWKLGIYVENYPAVVGTDASGVVEELGEGATSFAKGDRVAFQGYLADSNYSTFQQYTLIPVEIMFKIPSGMSFDDAATIPLGIGTAAVGLYLPSGEASRTFSPDGIAGVGLTPPWTAEGKDKYKDKAMVVLGGSSSVGQYAIQFGKLSGFSPIIATSSKEHEQDLKSYGVTHVVDRHGDQASEIKKLLPQGTADVVYDAISTEETQKIAISVSSSNALIVLTIKPIQNVDWGARTVARVFGSFHAQRKLGVSLCKAAPALLENGSLKPHSPQVVPGGLKGIIDAMEKMSKDHVSGVKLVAHPWD